jgi:heme exporter protein B
VEAVVSGTSAGPNLSLLGAILLVALVFTPWITALALRISIE